MKLPRIGDIVLSPLLGEIRPAIITRVHNDRMVNLQVFSDGNGIPNIGDKCASMVRIQNAEMNRDWIFRADEPTPVNAPTVIPTPPFQKPDEPVVIKPPGPPIVPEVPPAEPPPVPPAPEESVPGEPADPLVNPIMKRVSALAPAAFEMQTALRKSLKMMDDGRLQFLNVTDIDATKGMINQALDSAAAFIGNYNELLKFLSEQRLISVSQAVENILVLPPKPD